MGYLDAHVSPRTDLREGSRMAEPIVYIDRSRVGPGKLEQLKDGIRRLVEFVERREPRLISYGFFLDEEQLRMTVIAIHPDSASLELHMEIAGPEFRKLRELVELTEIEVYGRPSGGRSSSSRRRRECSARAGRSPCWRPMRGLLG
jgi:quinol monooxygenase YgiN